MTILPAPPPGWRRPSMPKGVKLAVLLRQAGEVRFDHRPPVSERPFDTEANDTIPPCNDPAHIDAITPKEHDVRTHGPGGEKRITTAGSDSGNRAHVRALTEAEQEFSRRLLAKAAGDPPRKSRWAKRKLQSRGFDRRT